MRAPDRYAVNSDAQASARLALEHRVGQAATAVAIADAYHQIWTEIESELFGIIGYRGIGVLYQRSLFLASREHAWLVPLRTGTLEPKDMVSFRVMLLQQTNATALASTSALLAVFHDLVAQLIGPSLATQLLGPVWDNAAAGRSAPDFSS